MKTTKQKIISYIKIIASILVVAILGSVFVNLGMDWYGTLSRPSSFVPNFLIPIMWTIIYVIFGIVLCNWAGKESLPKCVIVKLVVNGILNILWCLLFFTLNQTLWGLIAIVLLIYSSILLVMSMFKQNKIYGFLTSIYPLWVSIATCLNLALWILN